MTNTAKENKDQSGTYKSTDQNSVDMGAGANYRADTACSILLKLLDN
ncbi:MAG: hypothetical protein QMC67_10755 [Candidatus Wallbacteria bacterium]